MAVIVFVMTSQGGPPTAHASHPISPFLLWPDLKPGGDQNLTFATCPDPYPASWWFGVEEQWDAVLPGWDFTEISGCSVYANVRLDWEGSLGWCEPPIAVACYVWNGVTHGDHIDITSARILFDVNHPEGHTFSSFGPNWQKAISAHEWGHNLGLEDHGGTQCNEGTLMGQIDIDRKATDNPCFTGPTTPDLNSSHCGVYSYCHDTIGVSRPSGLMDWYLRNSNSGGSPDVPVFSYGVNSDKPVVGDWNGDGIDTIGVWRQGPSGFGEWYLRNSNTPGAPS